MLPHVRDQEILPRRWQVALEGLPLEAPWVHDKFGEGEWEEKGGLFHRDPYILAKLYYLIFHQPRFPWNTRWSPTCIVINGVTWSYPYEWPKITWGSLGLFHHYVEVWGPTEITGDFGPPVCHSTMIATMICFKGGCKKYNYSHQKTVV